jgi:hypothetical protein
MYGLGYVIPSNYDLQDDIPMTIFLSIIGLMLTIQSFHYISCTGRRVKTNILFPSISLFGTKLTK